MTIQKNTGLLSFFSDSGSSMSTDGHSECSLTAEHIARQSIGNVLTKGLLRRVTINMLPNDVLLEIFEWSLGEDQDDLEVDAWYPLVQVCRSWRNIVFRSPHRLNLRLFYTARPGKPACEMLRIWPAFPIIIQVNHNRSWSVDNVIAALKHKDRIRKIQLVGMDLEPIFPAMQEPFPALTDLDLTSSEWDEVPDSLLGGFAPCLRSLKLESIPCPKLSKLVSSSARNLVELSLMDFDAEGDVSPKTMVIALSALTKLESLSLAFPLDYFNVRLLKGLRGRNSTLLTGFVLPSLKFFLFQGTPGYLEDFVAMIDTPRLEILDITLCTYDSDIFKSTSKSGKTPQFNQFLHRTEMFETLDNASIHLWSDKLEITLSRKAWDAKVTLKIECQDKIETLGDVCMSKFLPVSDIESLGISSQYHKWHPHPDDDTEDCEWPFSLCRFSSLKSLYLSKDIVPSISRGLKDVLDVPQLLRSLRKISVATLKPLPSGSVKTEAIEEFAARRGLFAPDPPRVPFCWVADEGNAASDL